MYYDEAISLVKEGYLIQRPSWGDSYIYKNTYGDIMFMSIKSFEGNDIMHIKPYIPSKSDVEADDWREYE